MSECTKTENSFPTMIHLVIVELTKMNNDLTHSVERRCGHLTAKRETRGWN